MATDDHRPSFTMCEADRAWIDDVLARRRRRMEDSGMCVVTQTVERVARELRARAIVLENAARTLHTSPLWRAARDAVTLIEQTAVALREQAKLLDGKE